MGLFEAIIFFTAIYLIGKAIEKNHYKDIRRRELLLIKKPYISFSKNAIEEKEIKSANLVASSVVIGCDRFKQLLANLKNFFGGNVSSYESVLDRGRREAILRMRKIAHDNGADIVLNVKIETIALDPIYNKKTINPKICITAYGTAIRYAKQA